MFVSRFTVPNVCVWLWLIHSLNPVEAAQGGNSNPASKPLAAALSPAKWREVEACVDRALVNLAARQAPDGSFPTIPLGQPGVTSLCIMAFLSRGHQPGVGPYGEQLNRAMDFVIGCQRADGLLSKNGPAQWGRYQASSTAIYNHGITGLMLGEVYGQVTGPRAKAIKLAIEKGVEFTRQEQLLRKGVDKGGWRYLRVPPGEPMSDLSITSWQIMFMRSAKNAEFNIPVAYVEEATDYVRRCFIPKTGMFYYAVSERGPGEGASRGMVGAGILCLSMAGQHQTPMAQAAGNWLLAHPFRQFGEIIGSYDKFFYSAYYCSQAMAQLGGQHWERFFPPMAEVLLKSQLRDGSWPPEVASGGSESAVFGTALTTSLAVLSLTPPYQLLPVYQR